MARVESEREDLLREATAFVERAELMVPGYEEPIVVGFRKDGSASFFFGAEPVYQFNTAGELRRAYAGGLLYKAEQGRLVSLRRERTDQETALVRHELTPEEIDVFLANARQHLVSLLASLQRGHHQLLRQVPPAAELLPRMVAWLQGLPATIPIAQSPHAR